MKQTFSFCWVEILGIIAVVWLISVIAIPNIPGLIETTRAAKSQRSAMALASLSLAAKNSGCIPSGTRSAAVLDLIGGISVTNPAATNIVIRFQAKEMTPEELAAAVQFLMFDGYSLIYVPGGGQPTNL